MSLIEIVLLLVIAGICGAIGQSIGGSAGGGCFVSVAIGFIGALFGLYLSRALHLPDLFSVHIGGISFPIVWSIIGAALFMALMTLLRRGR